MINQVSKILILIWIIARLIINKQRVLCFFVLYLLKRNFKWTINDNQFIFLINYKSELTLISHDYLR